MASSSRIGLYADDHVSGTLDKIRGQFDTLGKNKGAQSILQGIGVGAGISAYGLLNDAISGVVSVVEDSVQKAKDEQVGIDRLTTSLKDNVAGWNGNSDAIETVIHAREKLAFSDGEQRDSLALLVTRTHDVAKALVLEREAMDLARLKGIDLADASNIIGKVYGGNVAILQRYGIAVTKGATATEALAQIQKASAGQAEAFANTAEGAAERSQIAIDNLQEDLGRHLLPAITSIALFAADNLVPALDDAVTGFDAVTKAIGDNQAVIQPLITTLELLSGTYAQLHQTSDAQAAGEAKYQALAEKLLQTTEDRIAATKAQNDAITKATAASNDAYTATRDLRKEVDDTAKAYDDWRGAIHDAARALNDQQRGHAETSLKIKGVKLDLKETSRELGKLQTDNPHPTLKIQQDINDLKLKMLDDRDQLTLLKADLTTAGKVRMSTTTYWIDQIKAHADTADAGVKKLLADLQRTGGAIGAAPGQRPNAGGQGAHGAAGGGYRPAGWSGAVGELGQEGMTLLPGGGAMITPHQGGGGGSGAPVMIQLHLDGRVVAQVVDRHLYYEAARAPQSPYSG
jgi:hypothetical protein